MRLNIMGGNFAIDFAQARRWCLPLEAGPAACPVVFLPGIVLSRGM
jgi:hypothetical protein